jgi:mannose-6-phosphate isomerase-like protein (cupin superfamily)
MADYTLVNVKDVDDMAPQFGMAPNLEARFAGGALGLEKSGVSYQKLAPNFRVPFGHKHKAQEELYVVVAGSGKLKLDDEVIDVQQWDLIRVASDTMRAFEAGPDGAEILAFGAPNTGSPREDVEMVPGWWSDRASRPGPKQTSASDARG